MSDQQASVTRLKTGYAQTFRTNMDTAEGQLRTTGGYEDYFIRSEVNMMSFFKSLKSRYHRQDVDPSLFMPKAMVSANILEHFKPAKEPDLSYKDKKKKKAEMKAASERIGVNGLTEHPTEYTGLLSDQWYRKIEKPSFVGLSPYDEDAVFDTTTKYHYEAGQEPADFSASDLYREYNPRMFDSDYIGENFPLVLDEVQRLKALVEYYNVPVNAGSLSAADQRQLGYVRQTLLLMKSCLEKSLNTHSLEIVNEEDLGISPRLDPTVAKKELAKAQEALAIHLMKSEIDDVKAKYKAEFPAHETHFVQEAQSRHDTEFKQKYPYAREVYHSEESYIDVNYFMEGIDLEENSQRVTGNREIIDRILMNFMLHERRFSQQQILSLALERNMEQSLDEEKQRGRSKNPELKDVLYRKNLALRKKDADDAVALYRAGLSEMKKALDYFIYGKGEMSYSIQMLLLQYGYRPEVNKQREAKDESDRLPNTMKHIDDTVEDLISRYVFPDYQNLVRKHIKNDPMKYNLFNCYTDEEKAKGFALLILIHRADLINTKAEFAHELRGEMGLIFNTHVSFDADEAETFYKNKQEELSAEIIGTSVRKLHDFNFMLFEQDHNPINLMAVQGSLMELSLTSSMLLRLKTINPNWRSMPQLNDKRITIQSTYADGLFMQSRGAALMALSVRGEADPLSHLTDEEKAVFLADDSYANDEERFYAAAERMIEDGKKLQDLAHSQLMFDAAQKIGQ